jgi:hypothetical protein
MPTKVAIVYSFGYPQSVHKFAFPAGSDPQYDQDIAILEEIGTLESERLTEYVQAQTVDSHLRLRLGFEDLKDYERRLEVFAKLVEELNLQDVMPARNEVPITEHESIWAMFDAVGFDPLRKAFTQERWQAVVPPLFSKKRYPEHVAIHYQDGKAIGIYRLDLITYDGTLHKQATSLNSFKHREEKREREAIRKDRKAHVVRWPTIEYTAVHAAADFDRSEAVHSLYSHLPIHRPATLYRFYNAIGYNRAKKRYWTQGNERNESGHSQVHS